ncbi:Fur family transcriptional regulator [Desulfothermobacter acidiphilus]|uniref:Fur family transcriptional regulator n=1 Tax=Desulfothermobacter acidiphilus TaxID=1938353 RepID=UPI003F89C642
MERNERQKKRDERAVKLRRLGLRATPQRLAILAYLEENRTHPSVEEIYHALKPRFPSLSLATVYGTLELLEQAGQIQLLTLDPERRRYDSDTTPHAHLYCRSCKRVYDLPGVEVVWDKLLGEREGFLIEQIWVDAAGLCPACRAKQDRDKA